MFFRETNFKETTIGEIPKDWNFTKLGDESVAHIIMGQSPPSSTYNKEGVGLPFFQGKLEFGNIYPSPEVYCSRPIKIAEPNDVLISVRAPAGAVNIAHSKSCIGRGLAATRPRIGRLNHLFLFYFLSVNGKKFESLSGGSTFKEIRRQELHSFVIPLPAPFEQQKIAEVLSTVDEAIQKTSEVIAKTERLKKGLMQELLTKGIGHKEFKETEIGRIPKGWEVARLGDFIDLQSGLYFKFSEFGKTGVRCFKIDNVGFGRSVWDTVTYLPENYLTEYHELVLNEGDIVMALNRPIINGKVKVVMVEKQDSPSILYQRVGRVILKNKDNLDTRYLFYVFTGEDFKQQLARALVGTDQPYIRSPLLLKVTIALPPLQEQQEITSIVSAVDEKLELERNEKARLERIKQGMMDLLLTGKVRVKMNN